MNGSSDVSAAVARLSTLAPQRLALDHRIQLCRECLARVCTLSDEWASAAVAGKGLPADSPLRSEDLLSGPAVVARQLQLMMQTFRRLRHSETIRFPGRLKTLPGGQLAVPVFPTTGFFDRLTFMGLRAHVRLQPDTPADGLHGDLLNRVLGGQVSGITVVLGAGNVSSIPATDSLDRILFGGRQVLLKMNPVNDYLTPIFQRAFEPLIRAGLLDIINGDGEAGVAAIHHPAVTDVHITGSAATHEQIVWGSPDERDERRRQNSPLLTKPVTSELGNVTPWIIVPGRYSDRQLTSQALHIAASITNNASFNCLATKVIVTWSRWEQRQTFLQLLQQILRECPARPAYYPGATERYRRYTGIDAGSGTDVVLPWTVLENQSPDERPDLFAEESFVCVCAETQLNAESPESFLLAAADFVNDRLSGTLCASVTVPDPFRTQKSAALEDCIRRLRYGSVCVNQWSGLAYGLTSPPWGAYPGATIGDPQSGIGNVHNTYLLGPVEKTVLDGPLINFPKPVWFPTHCNAVSVARGLVDLYHHPSAFRLPGLFAAALRG
ncbi:MAG: aldehyde dehydrogenase family protein [Planctomycetaceae bacterium]